MNVGWQLLVALHAVPTLAMCGLIWFVQVVHYPMLARLGGADFAAVEREHCRRTNRVVLPPMLVELGLAAALVAWAPADARAAAWVGLGLLATVWISTFVLQVPCHTRLLRGFDAATARRLVAANWIRTIAWSLRAVVAVILLVDA